MTRSIKSRLNRIEKLTENKNNKEWIAVIIEDKITVSLKGKSIKMTPEEFKKWEVDNPKGEKITIEWVE